MEIINIDFDCILGKSKILAVPEIVSFRLTRIIMIALGATECWGLFYFYFK